ncbi:acyltransferase family protein [Pseudoxanthomonas suwonensis]
MPADSTAAPVAATAARPLAAPRAGRIGSIDLARGLAVCLMIVSHGTNGLMPYADFPDWGQVPVHVLTKFSSSLFFIVFGIALAVAFVPKTGAADWPQRRNHLIRRGLLVLLWYKLLTAVELWDRGPEAVVDALLYRSFPSFVEILGFYAIALLWIPWLLPLWARTPALLRWASPLLVGGLWWWISGHVDFDSRPLRAILVEDHELYTWGQLSRLPLVLLGLLVGGLLRCWNGETRGRLLLAAGITVAGAGLLAAFATLAGDVHAVLVEIGRNHGKHPPGLLFSLFSVGGALVLLGLCVAGGNVLASWLRPLAIVGSDSLMAFIVHISVIFLLLRGTFGYYQAVSYEYALLLSGGLILVTAAWIAPWQALRARLRQARAHGRDAHAA